ncbi:hypothetical protein ACHAXS_006913 [Conticribra weissflogii]
MVRFLPNNRQSGNGAKAKTKFYLPILGLSLVAVWALLDSFSYFSGEGGDPGIDNVWRSLAEVFVTSDSEEVEVAPAELPPSFSMQKFIIISQQRSGTGLLTSLLDNHSNIRCGHEEFNLQLEKTHLHKLMHHITIDPYMQQLHLFMEELPFSKKIKFGQSLNLTHVGFEIMYNQGVIAYHTNLLHQFRRENIKVIHLIRQNKLLQYISTRSNDLDKREPADGPHDPHPTDPHKSSAVKSLHLPVNVPDVLQFIFRTRGEVGYIEDLLAAEFSTDGYHRIYYEDLNRDIQGEMNRLFDFLGVKHEVVESELTKIHEGHRARRYFENGNNRNDIDAALRNSKYSFMLDPDPPSYPGW